MRTNIFKEKYLLFRAKNKDPEAFSSVYDLYVDRIYRFIFFKVNKQEDAQDLTSEVFLKTWEYINQGKEISNLNALIYKIARNLVIDYYRKNVSKEKEISLEDSQDLLEKEMEVIDQNWQKIDVKIQTEKIEAKLMLLKNEYREVIILRYIDSLSIDEIAEILEKKKGAVRVLIFRALNTLRQLMGEE